MIVEDAVVSLAPTVHRGSVSPRRISYSVRQAAIVLAYLVFCTACSAQRPRRRILISSVEWTHCWAMAVTFNSVAAKSV